MKQSVFFVIMFIFLAGLNSAPHDEIQAEQNAVVEAKKLTPEQSEAIEEYLKTVEQTLRDDGGFDEATIQQALEIKRAEEEKKFLEQ